MEGARAPVVRTHKFEDEKTPLFPDYRPGVLPLLLDCHVMQNSTSPCFIPFWACKCKEKNDMFSFLIAVTENIIMRKASLVNSSLFRFKYEVCIKCVHFIKQGYHIYQNRDFQVISAGKTSLIFCVNLTYILNLNGIFSVNLCKSDKL